MAGLCEGRVAIVTGAGRGVGREHALLLAANGARVVVNDLGANVDGTGQDASFASQTVADIRKAGGEAMVNGDDVSSWAGAKNMIDSALKAYGKLDIVVNNAGILRDRMLVNMSEEEWDAVIRVHLKGTFAPSRHAAAYWRELQKTTGEPVMGRIINTTSTSGIYGNVGQTNYGAAKAGIAAFTIIAARELKRIGVTVNAISPSAQTRMTEGLRVVNDEQRAMRDPKWVSPRGHLPGERTGPGHHGPRDPGRRRAHRRVRRLAARRGSAAGDRSGRGRQVAARDAAESPKELGHGRPGTGLRTQWRSITTT